MRQSGSGGFCRIYAYTDEYKINRAFDVLYRLDYAYNIIVRRIIIKLSGLLLKLLKTTYIPFKCVCRAFGRMKQITNFRYKIIDQIPYCTTSINGPLLYLCIRKNVTRNAALSLQSKCYKLKLGEGF